MKILLIEHPRTFNPDRCNDIANTPLASCLMSGYAAAMLRSAGHEVEIVEGHLEGLSYDEVRARVEDYQPHVLGVHMVYNWKLDEDLFNFLSALKAAGHAPHITAFGFYPTIARQEILSTSSAVDSVIVGEHEHTFCDLAAAVSSGSDMKGIPGLMTRAAGADGFSPRPVQQDLDSVPFPVRTEALLRLSEVNLLGSRGCYGRCTFCYINPFYGQGSLWRGRSPENIIREVDEIIERHGKRKFYFTDPNFFGSGKRGQNRALAIAALLKTRGITFGIEGRVNDIHDATIEPLVDAGLRHILIGLESGGDESLKRMNKMTTVAQNERALSVLRRHGVEPNVGFIMFEPDSDLPDIRTNLEFLRRNDLLKDLSITANMLYHHQIVLKGTPAYRGLKESGRLEVSASAPYEGIASFSNEKVASLADVMRRLTNYLFNRLSGVWSGQVPISPGNSVKFGRMNSLLLGAFEDTLKALESGRTLEPSDIGEIVQRESLALGAVIDTL